MRAFKLVIPKPAGVDAAARLAIVLAETETLARARLRDWGRERGIDVEWIEHRLTEVVEIDLQAPGVVGYVEIGPKV